jgi:hypothetical protein
MGRDPGRKGEAAGRILRFIINRRLSLAIRHNPRSRRHFIGPAIPEGKAPKRFRLPSMICATLPQNRS